MQAVAACVAECVCYALLCIAVRLNLLCSMLQAKKRGEFLKRGKKFVEGECLKRGESLKSPSTDV